MNPPERPVRTHESAIPMRKRQETLMMREVDQEVLLLDLESDRIHQLNQTASFIWRLCDEVDSVEEIAARLAAEFEVEEDVAQKDVIETLDTLRGLKLLLDT
jgi:hypothetical protein